MKKQSFFDLATNAEVSKYLTPALTGAVIGAPLTAAAGHFLRKKKKNEDGEEEDFDMQQLVNDAIFGGLAGFGSGAAYGHFKGVNPEVDVLTKARSAALDKTIATLPAENQFAIGAAPFVGPSVAMAGTAGTGLLLSRALGAHGAESRVTEANNNLKTLLNSSKSFSEKQRIAEVVKQYAAAGALPKSQGALKEFLFGTTAYKEKSLIDALRTQVPDMKTTQLYKALMGTVGGKTQSPELKALQDAWDEKFKKLKGTSKRDEFAKTNPRPTIKDVEHLPKTNQRILAGTGISREKVKEIVRAVDRIKVTPGYIPKSPTLLPGKARFILPILAAGGTVVGTNFLPGVYRDAVTAPLKTPESMDRFNKQLAAEIERIKSEAAKKAE